MSDFQKARADVRVAEAELAKARARLATLPPDDLSAVADRAITAAGGRMYVARCRGISRQAVDRWVNVLRKIPLAQVPAMSKLSGIPMKELRPDVEWE